MTISSVGKKLRFEVHFHLSETQINHANSYLKDSLTESKTQSQ